MAPASVFGWHKDKATRGRPRYHYPMLEGAPPEAKIGTLNMADERDRGLVRRKLDGHLRGHNKRWGGIDEQFKSDAIAALRVALRWALEGKDARAVKGIVLTLGSLERQNQADELNAERLAAGRERLERAIQAGAGGPAPLGVTGGMLMQTIILAVPADMQAATIAKVREQLLLEEQTGEEEVDS